MNYVPMMPTEGALSESYQVALSLHRKIMTNIEIAASSMIAFCGSLKKMRDGRLYIELGFDTFDDYVEGAVGLKRRQAYNYISVLERLPATVLQSNAHLGITKLELLARLPASERDELITDNDLEDTSVRELQEKIRELEGQCEQLTVLNEGGEEDRRRLEAAKHEQRKRLAALEAREVDLTAELEAARAQAAPDDAELERLRKELEQEAAEKIKQARQEARNQALKDAEQRISGAQKEGAQAAEMRLRVSIEAAEQEKAAALQRAADLEKQLKVAGDSDTLRFSLYFEEFQGAFNQVLSVIQKLKGEGRDDDAEKFAGALSKALDMLKDKCAG